MDDVNYRPYCGNNISRDAVNGCYNPRTQYRPSDGQFICPHCKWISDFPQDFIDRYKKKHNLSPEMDEKEMKERAEEEGSDYWIDQNEMERGI